MLKVGIIGLGEVSQLMHLPILQDLGDMFRVTAISDVSPSLTAFIQDKYHIAQTYLDGNALIEKSDTDVIFILSPDQYHGEYAARALKAGKHVFIEKPATLCSQELEELIALQEEHPAQTVMVGYMRRYAGPFLKAKELMRSEPKQTQYLRFTDIICEGPFFIGQTRPVFYPDDVPQEAIADGSVRKRHQLDLAIGKDAADAARQAYTMLTGLGCHSLSAVRELFGMPKKIRSVTSAQNGQHLVAVFEYDGFLGVYELVNNQAVVQFDAAIEIFQHDRKLKIKYETPYIRYQPLHLEVSETDGKDTKTTVYGPEYRDAFQTELTEFYRCCTEGKTPHTPLADARDDLKLFAQMIAMMDKE